MSYKEITKDIKEDNIKKVYLFHGDESYLINHFILEIKNKIVLKDFEELNYVRIEEKDFSVDKLINSLETLPFMSDRKLVTVKNPELFTGKKKSISEEDEQRLINYLNNLPSTVCLLLVVYGSIDSRKKIIKEIKKSGMIISFEKLEPLELQRWIEKILKGYGKEMNQEEIGYFLENLNYFDKSGVQDLYNIENEIKKLVSFMGDRRVISKADIEAIFVSTSQNNIFKLIASIEKGNVRDAISQLNDLVNEGEPTIKILSFISNHIRNLFKTKLLLSQGYSSKMIAQELKVHPYAAGKYVEQSRGFKENRLRALINLTLDFDAKIKLSKIKQQIAAELLIIEMCRKEY